MELARLKKGTLKKKFTLMLNAASHARLKRESEDTKFSMAVIIEKALRVYWGKK
jgi:hypothetical protein